MTPGGRPRSAPGPVHRRRAARAPGADHNSPPAARDRSSLTPAYAPCVPHCHPLWLPSMSAGRGPARLAGGTTAIAIHALLSEHGVDLIVGVLQHIGGLSLAQEDAVHDRRHDG